MAVHLCATAEALNCCVMFWNIRCDVQINKPIVEKKRRERINSCLDELKDLLLQHASKHEVHTALYHYSSILRSLSAWFLITADN